MEAAGKQGNRQSRQNRDETHGQHQEGQDLRRRMSESRIVTAWLASLDRPAHDTHVSRALADHAADVATVIPFNDQRHVCHDHWSAIPVGVILDRETGPRVEGERSIAPLDAMIIAVNRLRHVQRVTVSKVELGCHAKQVNGRVVRVMKRQISGQDPHVDIIVVSLGDRLDFLVRLRLRP